MDLKNIKLYLDGVTHTFAEWTDDFVNKFYPDLGQRSYRVPALHFNQQQLVGGKVFDGLELHNPDLGNAQGDLAHTLVLETMEQLSHALEQEEEPLFIISALDYDNYLARVKAPPSRKVKEKQKQIEAKTLSKGTKKDNDDANILIRDTKLEHQGKTHGKNAKRDLIVPHDKAINNETSFKLDNKLEDKLLPKARDSEGTRKEALAASCADSVPKEQVVNMSKTLFGATAKFNPDTPDILRETAEKVTISSEKEKPVENQNEDFQPATKPKKQKKKKKKATAVDVTEENINVDSNEMAAKTQQTPRKPMSGKGLPPKPQDITNNGLRGDIDVMLLHKQQGVILMEVKATGHPGWCHTDEEIRNRVQKAIQVKQGRDVFHFIMPDLSCVPCVTLIVAFPYLTKQKLDQVLSSLPSDPEILFLCKEDMTSVSEVPSEYSTTSIADSDHREEAAAVQLAILTWWNNLVTAMRGSPLPLEDMKTIVGRTCGLLSVVSVWTRTKPRVQIRTAGQAISQVADRFSNIVLLPTQANLLAHPSPSCLVLTGPMGSGKTLMLQLKGRQWVQEGKRVVVLNVRASERGRPIGHALEEAIRSVEPSEHSSGSVERFDIATRELDVQAFHAELEGLGPTDKLCFVLDELTHHTFFLLDDLKLRYPNCCIWCVAMFLRQLPVGFHHFRLGAVLRSPPSVQLLLKELDLNPDHNDAYSTRSASRGLPCDGPPVIFIQHKQHSTDTRPQDCVHCADQLVDVLQDTLGLVFSNQLCADSPQKAVKTRVQPKVVQAKPLSFHDVIFLVCVPLGYYKQQSTGLWLSPIKDVLKFYEYVQSCPFITRLKEHSVPMRIILDNTSREIGLPSTDEILVTDVMGVQSLERKVVFYLPGGSVLDSTPIKTGSSNGQQLSFSGKEKSVTSSTNQITQSWPSGEGISSQETMSANQTEHLQGIQVKSTPANTIKEDRSLDSSDSNTICAASTESKKGNPASSSKGEQLPTVSEILLRNTTVVGVGVISANESDLTEVTSAEGNSLTQTGKLRMGMDLRGDSPLLISALSQTQHPIMPLEQEEFMKTSVPVDCISAQSVFLVPDVQHEEGRRQSEMYHIHEAMASLSMDDQDWLFMAAARCLSQLIVVIP